MTVRKLDRYIIRSRVGEGGMATVYHAWDPLFERDVAIKILPKRFSQSKTFRTRFSREARIIAALEHPAIVPVYDLGEKNNQPYIIMRYMSGGTLGERLARGVLSLKEAADNVDRLASALDEAHRRGIIHRDLKPENVLFDEQGRAYLTDFGIAKLLSSQARLTGNTVLGSPAYMSPEQGRGSPDIDGRSDVYALGCMVFEMLSGRPPYVDNTPTGQILRHVKDPVPEIRGFNKNLPIGVQLLIDRSLAKDPEDRYKKAGDLAVDLRDVSEGRSIALWMKHNGRLASLWRPFKRASQNVGRDIRSRTIDRIKLRKPEGNKPGPGVWVFLLLFVVIGLLWLVLPGYLTPDQSTPVTLTSTSTPIPITSTNVPEPTPIPEVFGQILEAAALVKWTGSDGHIQQIGTGFNLPLHSEIELESGGGIARISLATGALLALGRDTKVVIIPGNNESATEVLLDAGLVLVEDGKFAITMAERQYSARLEQGVMGIIFDPESDQVTIDCLEGLCFFSNERIPPGWRYIYKSGENVERTEAGMSSWSALRGVVDAPATQTVTIAPTATPTGTSLPVIIVASPTFTASPKPTDEETNTPEPPDTSTPTPIIFTNTPTPTDFPTVTPTPEPSVTRTEHPPTP